MPKPKEPKAPKEPKLKKLSAARERELAAQEAESKRVWNILGNLPEEQDTAEVLWKP